MEEELPGSKILDFKKSVKKIKNKKKKEKKKQKTKESKDYRDMTDEEVNFHAKVDDLGSLLVVADTIVNEICELEKIAFNAKEMSENLARLLTNWIALNEVFDKYYEDC